MGEFEDRLYRDLMAAHGDTLATADCRPPARPPRSRGRAVAAAAVVAAVVLGVVGVGDLAGEGTPLIANGVDTEHTVLIALDDIRAIGPANERMRELGVRAKVVPSLVGCRMFEQSGPTYPGELKMSYSPINAPEDMIRIGTDIPEGYTVLMSFASYPDGSGSGLSYTPPFKDPVADCFDDHAETEARYRAGELAREGRRGAEREGGR